MDSNHIFFIERKILFTCYCFRIFKNFMHDISNNPIITLLPLTILPIPHPSSHWLVLSISESAYFLLCSLVFCIFQIMHILISDVIHCLFFSDIISLSIMPSKSIHATTYGKISLFFMTELVLHCTYIPHLFYPLICRQTLKFLPYLGNCR